MSEAIERKLAEAKNAYLIAPAGYGKTEIIVRAVASKEFGKELLLTHTHAGVRSLRERLKRHGVASNRHHVNTIGSWALKYASSYPSLSGLSNVQPQGNDWKEVYTTAINVLKHENIRSVIKQSYSGVFVDEYQDCTQSQHEMIVALIDLLPVRILGDPLQGIFGFDDDPIVDWKQNVYPYFEELEPLSKPWRWKGVNPKLGKWLDEVRSALIDGDEIDLRTAPGDSVRWLQSDQQAARDACFAANRLKGSVVVIRKWPNQAHTLARQLGGVYTSMEEVECRDLITWARKLDKADGNGRALAILEGAGSCWTKLNGQLKSVRTALEGGRQPKSRKYPEINDALIKVTENPDDVVLLGDALDHCKAAGDVLFRRELWREMRRTFETFRRGGFDGFEDTAWHIRNQARREGRRLDQRLVSRTLLIKGLEFNHAIVVNADELDDAKNLYVALTRASTTLTVLSSAPILKRPPLSQT